LVSISLIETGVPGLDEILAGGIAKGSLVLITGPSGAGKTILATQMLFHHAKAGKRVLILSVLTEASSKLIAHLDSLEYFDSSLLGDEVRILNIQHMLDSKGLDAALDEILTLVMKDGIELMLIESVHSLYALIEDASAVQDFLFRLGSSLFQVGCTAIMVTPRDAFTSASSLEAVISDVTLELAVSLVGKRQVRELQVIKERGSPPLSGLHSYDITNAGIRLYPRIETRAVLEEVPAADGRLSWGVPRLDELTGGGIRLYDTTLVLGTTGVGKTTLGLHFLADGVANGESCLYVTFHETAGRLLEKSEDFGMSLSRSVGASNLQVAYVPPAALDVDSVLNRIVSEVEHRRVKRLVIDTLNPLELVATREGRYPEVLPALLNVLQAAGVTALMLRETTQVIGDSLDLGDALGAYWTPFDNILLLRPVELDGAVKRILSVLKMRRSDHDERFYRLDIGARGLEIGQTLQGLAGLLTGLPRRAVA